MTKDETSAMAGTMGLEVTDFCAKHTDGRVAGSEYRRLVSTENGCSMLSGENRCSVYEGRPMQCRTCENWGMRGRGGGEEMEMD